MHLKQQFKFMYAVAIWTDFCEPDWLFRILSVLHASGAQSGLTHGLCMSVLCITSRGTHGSCRAEIWTHSKQYNSKHNKQRNKQEKI